MGGKRGGNIYYIVKYLLYLKHGLPVQKPPNDRKNGNILLPAEGIYCHIL
jgi:hypothetical protein